MGPPQQLLILGEGAPLPDGLRTGVEVQVVGGDLDVGDAVRRDAPLPLPGLQVQHKAALPVGQGPQGPLELVGEGDVVEGLEDVVKGVDRVAVDGVLGQVGHKDNHHLFVHLADAPGGLDAQHVRHPDVQQRQVRVLAVGVQQLVGPVVHLQHAGEVRVLPLVGVKKLRQLPGLALLVLQNTDFHPLTPCPFLTCFKQIIQDEAAFDNGSSPTLWPMPYGVAILQFCFYFIIFDIFVMPLRFHTFCIKIV